MEFKVQAETAFVVVLIIIGTEKDTLSPSCTPLLLFSLSETKLRGFIHIVKNIN